MLTGLVGLLVKLVALAIVAYIGRAVMQGLGALAWMYTVAGGIVLLIALYFVAQFFGFNLG